MNIKKYKIVFILVIPLIMLPSIIQGAKKQIIEVQIRLLRGSWMENQAPLLKNIKILDASSFPEIATLKTLLKEPEGVLKAALIDILMDSMDFSTLDDIFSGTSIWHWKDDINIPIMQRPASAYRIVLKLKKLSPDTLSFHSKLYFKEIEISDPSIKQSDKKLTEELKKYWDFNRYQEMMDQILDKEFELKKDTPIIIGVPLKEGAFFLIFSWSYVDPFQKKILTKETTNFKKAVPIKEAKPIKTVLPVYPLKLRDKGIKGDVKLKVTIDQKGSVQIVEILQSLHPYLDNSAMNAMKQWTFQPFIQNKKPMAGIFNFTFNFNPKVWDRYEERMKAEEKQSNIDSNQKELETILKKGAEYCEKLNQSVFDFICEETIKETHYNFRKDIDTWKYSEIIVATNKSNKRFHFKNWRRKIWDPFLTKKNKFLCDYQLIRKDNQTQERRIVLKKNGKKTKDQKTLLNDIRFSNYNSIFVPIKLLSKNNQHLFNYNLLKEKRINGVKTFVVKAIPKINNMGDVEYAKIWMDKKQYSILKIEIVGFPLEGYDDILERMTELNVKPDCTITYAYKVKYQDVYFPSKTSVRIYYPIEISNSKKLRRLVTDIKYNKHKFFSVKTDHEIIK